MESGPPQPKAPTTKDPKNNILAIVGWITAVLVPIVGAIIGIILITRRDSRGWPIIGLAVVVTAIVVVLSSGS
jgi:hypothetical protein